MTVAADPERALQHLKSIGWLVVLAVATAGIVWLSATAARQLLAGHTETALIKIAVAIYLAWVVATALRHVRHIVAWVAGCFGYIREDRHPDLL